MEEYRIIAILNKSDGNAEVGDMWQETKIFKSTDNLDDVIKWAIHPMLVCNIKTLSHRLQIQIAQ